MEWNIEYYFDDKGYCPVKKFVDELSPEGQAKYIFITRLLKEYGVHVKDLMLSLLQGTRSYLK